MPIDWERYSIDIFISNLIATEQDDKIWFSITILWVIGSNEIFKIDANVQMNVLIAFRYYMHFFL